MQPLHHEDGGSHLCNFTQCASFLAEIDNHSAAAVLRLLHGLLNSEQEIRTAGADIGSKDIRAVTLVVDTESQLAVRIRHLLRIAKSVDSETTNWREEDLDIRTGDKLGERSTSVFE